MDLKHFTLKVLSIFINLIKELTRENAEIPAKAPFYSKNSPMKLPLLQLSVQITIKF